MVYQVQEAGHYELPPDRVLECDYMGPCPCLFPRDAGDFAVHQAPGPSTT